VQACRRLNETKTDQQLEKTQMKISKHGAYRAVTNSRSAFTLIEMIGVLAVIAILASMLIPRVFEAINSARVNATVVNCDTIKTAAADHYGKYGQFNMLNGSSNIFPAATPAIYFGYDTNVLMPEGLLDKPFSAKIAGADVNPNSIVELVQGQAGNNGTGYKLDGANLATANASYVIEAVLKAVSQADAKDLNDRIDGTALGVPIGTADTLGRVEYSASNPTDVYVYLTHR
jgi:prepilin-type N-terminal cleavage/methylation domain-containing protein